MLEGWGSTAALTNMILYIPQIITTYRAQHEGVLSLASLWISVIGDGLLAIFWVISAGESVWVYMSLAADAGMQLILIVMIMRFRRERKERQQQQQSYVLLVDGSTTADHPMVDDNDRDRWGMGTLVLQFFLWFMPGEYDRVEVSPWDGPPSSTSARGWEQLP